MCKLDKSQSSAITFDSSTSNEWIARKRLVIYVPVPPHQAVYVEHTSSFCADGSFARFWVPVNQIVLFFLCGFAGLSASLPQTSLIPEPTIERSIDGRRFIRLPRFSCLKSSYQAHSPR